MHLYNVMPNIAAQAAGKELGPVHIGQKPQQIMADNVDFP